MTFVATLAFGLRPRQRGLARVRAKWKLGNQSKRKPKNQSKEVARVRAKKKPETKEARESHHILLGVLESVREYEGVNPHTPKATPILGGGVPEDFRNFRERLQGSKLNGLWRSLYN